MNTDDIRDFACRLITFASDWDMAGKAEMNDLEMAKEGFIEQLKKLLEV